jgi:hypothetical protein
MATLQVLPLASIVLLTDACEKGRNENICEQLRVSYYTPEQDYYVVHRPDRFHDNSRRRRRRRRRRENRRAFSHTQSKS